MTITHKTILKHLSKLYSIAKNELNITRLLDEVEDECYELLDYINKVRKYNAM